MILELVSGSLTYCIGQTIKQNEEELESSGVYKTLKESNVFTEPSERLSKKETTNKEAVFSSHIKNNSGQKFITAGFKWLQIPIRNKRYSEDEHFEVDDNNYIATT